MLDDNDEELPEEGLLSDTVNKYSSANSMIQPQNKWN